jgi:hypothetical protein
MSRLTRKSLETIQGMEKAEVKEIAAPRVVLQGKTNLVSNQ